MDFNAIMELLICFNIDSFTVGFSVWKIQDRVAKGWNMLQNVVLV